MAKQAIFKLGLWQSFFPPSGGVNSFPLRCSLLLREKYSFTPRCEKGLQGYVLFPHREGGTAADRPFQIDTHWSQPSLVLDQCLIVVFRTILFRESHLESFHHVTRRSYNVEPAHTTDSPPSCLLKSPRWHLTNNYAWRIKSTSRVIVFATSFFHWVIYLTNHCFIKGFYATTSTQQGRHNSVASSTRHERPIISRDTIHLLSLRDAIGSDNSDNDEFVGYLNLEDS